MMTLEQLPPKGVKREQAILELGKDEANGELLFQLVNTEKGKCKTAAQKALAQLEYAPAAPLWAKLVKGKWMGSNIMSDACSDCVSEQIAPVILKTLSQLLDEGDTKPLDIEQLNFCFHLMLGKASPKMLEVYRFLAENTQRIAQLKRTPVYSDDDCTSWWITDGLRIWDATPKEKEKIPAVVLTASLIRNPDERLQALADELNERYGGSWLMPVFMKAIITQPKEQVYETYSPLLDTPQKGYLFHALGMLHYRCYPEGWTYERLGPDGMIALIFWGDYSYGTYDTRFMIERYVDLDERWLFDLAKDPEGRKPTVTWQTYNRGGVLYGSYDEMFISLLPLKVENPELKRILWDYFRIRSQKKKVAIVSGQVLQCPYDFQKARLVAREMADALALDLVDKRLVTDQLVLTVGYESLADPKQRVSYQGVITTDRYGRKIPKHAHGTENLSGYTSSASDLMNAVSKLYDRIVDPALLIRRLSISANRLLDEDTAQQRETVEQLDLFTDYDAKAEQQEEDAASHARERKIQEAMLDIKRKYGKNAILKGLNFEEGATAKERNQQIGGHQA